MMIWKGHEDFDFFSQSWEDTLGEINQQVIGEYPKLQIAPYQTDQRKWAF